jgi:hypothetical protein
MFGVVGQIELCARPFFMIVAIGGIEHRAAASSGDGAF